MPVELQIKCGNGWKEITSDLPGIWRYLLLIPISKDSAYRIMNYDKPEIQPPVRCGKLAEVLGIRDLFLLDCTSGPSGTFKDTEAAVVIGKCLDWGLNDCLLAWHSTANTARAYREYALNADLASYSFFPLECLYKWAGATQGERGKVIAYNGPFQELAAVARQQAAKLGCKYLAPFAWKLEGKACLAYTIMEYIPNVDYIVQTVAGGYGPLGINLGLQRLLALGVVQRQKARFKLFQINGADTISQLMPLNREIDATDLVLPKNSFEPTLQSTNPLATFNSLRKILIDSRSDIQSVTPTEVENEGQLFNQACNDLGINLSYDVEKSPFISWAGLMRDSRRGRLSKDASIVLILTGSPTRQGGLPKLDEIIYQRN